MCNSCVIDSLVRNNLNAGAGDIGFKERFWIHVNSRVLVLFSLFSGCYSIFIWFAAVNTLLVVNMILALGVVPSA